MVCASGARGRGSVPARLDCWLEQFVSGGACGGVFGVGLARLTRGEDIQAVGAVLAGKLLQSRRAATARSRDRVELADRGSGCHDHGLLVGADEVIDGERVGLCDRVRLALCYTCVSHIGASFRCGKVRSSGSNTRSGRFVSVRGFDRTVRRIVIGLMWE